ncbi:hypothetical protein SAY86_006488 [Trapa natans]|uniref:WRKY domain-containing protein n=1 Tax=Trapa natans TaxID=22666 RepID=A0AAN7LC55_TRANT|nr:hypothetical protein SAY86_006488 [Trapa natans]
MVSVSLSPAMNEGAVDEELRKPPTLPAKKRKGVEKTVIRVRVGTEIGREKNESPPYDSWSWRKYGQKSIKGSPYPRGYYRCSTAKGCLAKKQVERCKSDASVLIITYTSSHNHPEGIRSLARISKQTRQQRVLSPDSQGSKDPQEQEPPAQNQEAQVPQRSTMEPEEFHYSHNLPVGELFTTSQLDTAGNNGSLGLALLEERSAHDALPLESGGNSISSESAPTARPAEPEADEDDYYDLFDDLEELHPTISFFSYGLQEGHHRHHQLAR